MPPQHIGIVACSAPGAALCFQTICIEGQRYLGRFGHPEISMHCPSFSEYFKGIESGDWDAVAELMLVSARILAEAGADFCISPDNTIHQAFDRVEAASPVPWLHIADVVGQEARSRGYRKLGILGTKFLMAGPVYPERLGRLGIEHLIPPEDEREQINEIIFTELVNHVFTDESRQWFCGVIARLKTEGCDSVVLRCTELPLVVIDDCSPLPTLDSTRLLARAALKKAVDSTAR